MSVSANAVIGSNTIAVTANGQTSNSAAFTLDGPTHMVVVSNQLGKCSGCQTSVERDVTYEVVNYSGSAANGINISEMLSLSGWNCNQSQPNPITTQCADALYTNSAGEFRDSWTIGSDGFTPAGCGANILDHWQWCASGNTVGTLTGYGHTNAISINGVVSPPNQLAPGTVINP